MTEQFGVELGQERLPDAPLARMRNFGRYARPRPAASTPARSEHGCLRSTAGAPALRCRADTLVETIETRWPAIEVISLTELTNARNESTNRLGQAGETRRLRVSEPGQLPPPSAVTLHPAHLPIRSEEPGGADLRLKTR
jgi:hypothetical protein